MQSKYRWEFIYLGANQDAFAVASSMAIKTNAQFCNKLQFNANTIGTRDVLVSGAVCARAWKADGNDTASPLTGSSQPDVQVNIHVGKEK